MAYQPLQNYLRTFRRKHALSQKELASLLGVVSGGKISRYEKFSRFPPALTVFALEIIFGAPARVLFAGAHAAVRRTVRARARKLIRRLGRMPPDSRTARKLALLKAIVESKPNQETNP